MTNGDNLLGEETRDLRTGRGNPDDTGHELRTQRRGNRYLAAGLATLALATIASLALSVAYHDQPFPNPEAKIFGTLVLVNLAAFGASLIAVGLIERMLRGNRARQIAGGKVAYERGKEATILLQRQIVDQQAQHEELKELLTVVMGQMGATVGRLAALEQGQQLLIELLPEETQRRYWAGFNDAVREGFKATGTDGSAKQRGRHMGLVAPPEEPQN